MRRERPWDLRRRVAADTFEAIRKDRLRTSVPVARLLAEIEERLLDPDLQVEDLRRASGHRDKNLSTQFARELGQPPSSYVLQHRMTIAGRMLGAGNHKVWQVGKEVGYLAHNSFGRAFKSWCSQSPTQFRKAARAAAAAGEPPPRLPGELLNEEERDRAGSGDLPAAEAAVLGGMQEAVRDHYHAPVPAVPREDRVELLMAERLWGWIEVLPFEEQKAAVESQANAFRTSALFHRLCTSPHRRKRRRKANYRLLRKKCTEIRESFRRKNLIQFSQLSTERLPGVPGAATGRQRPACGPGRRKEESCSHPSPDT